MFRATGLLLEILLELKKIRTLLTKEVKMTQALTDIDTELVAEVAEDTAVISSAIALLDGIDVRIAAAIANADDDSAAVKAVTDVLGQLKASKTALADAVAKNTPAAVPVAPVVPTLPSP